MRDDIDVGRVSNHSGSKSSGFGNGTRIAFDHMLLQCESMDLRMNGRRGRRRKPGLPAILKMLAGEFAGDPLLLARESGLLVVISALDLFMTYILLRSGFHFYESNPVAQWWFTRWNIAGMTVFKFLVVSVAIVASEVVERRRPGLGQGILRIGIVAAGAVVIYSLALLVRHQAPVFD
jgi:hypothetical protein